MTDSSNLHIVPDTRPVPPFIQKILSAVDHATKEHGCSYLVVGATGRDLLLYHVFGVPATRATRDVDFAIAVESWEKFNSVRETLLRTGLFKPSRTEHRIFFKDLDIPVDLIPFGGVAEDETIAWPPTRDTIMSVAGFEDALAASVRIEIAPGQIVPVISLPALAILKIFARHDRKTDKDALDLFKIVSTYGETEGNEDRLYSERNELMQKYDFDRELAGASLAGEDSRAISSPGTLERLQAVIGTEEFVAAVAEQIRISRWQFDPDKLNYVRSILDAYFGELLNVS